MGWLHRLKVSSMSNRKSVSKCNDCIVNEGMVYRVMIKEMEEGVCLFEEVKE